MNKLLSILLGALLAAGAVNALASPEQDLKATQNYFKHKNPNIKMQDYVYGALAYDADALNQYKSIMSFPPFESTVDQGKKMWDTPFKNGKTYASCFPNGGKNVAGNYPYFDDKEDKVVTFEMAINQCRKDNGEEEYSYSDMKTMGVLTSYARTLSDGMKMNVKVKGPKAIAAYESGKEFFYRRRGQLNFSCASCHVDNADNRIRAEVLSPLVGQASHWPVFRGGDKLFTLQHRYVGCNKQVRAEPFKEGSTEYNNLEYFHSYMSNGLPLHASVFRK